MLLSLRVLLISPGHYYMMKRLVSSIIVRMTVNIAGGAWYPKNPAHTVVPNTNFLVLCWLHWSFKGGTKAPISANVLAKPADIRWGFVDWSFTRTCNAQKEPVHSRTPQLQTGRIENPSLSHNSGSTRHQAWPTKPEAPGVWLRVWLEPRKSQLSSRPPAHPPPFGVAWVPRCKRRYCMARLHIFFGELKSLICIYI